MSATSPTQPGLELLAPTARLHSAEGTVEHPSRQRLLDEIAGGHDVWLDLVGASDDQLRRLGDDLDLPALVVESAVSFTRGMGISSVGEATLVVARAVSGPSHHLVPVHVVHRHGVVVTVRREDCDPLDEVAGWPRLPHELGRGARFVLFRLLLAIADSYLPPLGAIDDRLDDLEDEVFAGVTDDQLVELTALRRTLSDYRRAVTPLRNRLAGGASIVLHELAEADLEVERYARDVYDQLVHVAEGIEAERDHVDAVMDVYLSMVSNAQNQVMKQLTVVATIFLPLSFIVGFFGMNFQTMVENVRSPLAFVALGLGVQVAVVVGLLVLFKRRRWI